MGQQGGCSNFSKRSQISSIRLQFRVNHTSKTFFKKNANLIKNYKKLWEENTDFQKAFIEAQKEHPDITEDVFSLFLDGKWSFNRFDQDEAQKNFENLLRNPNMNDKDKSWMTKVIKLLRENNLLTYDNFKKLDAIVYTPQFIEIWWVKWLRKDLDSKKNEYSSIYNSKTYFKWTPEMIKEQSEILDKYKMKIPSETDYESSLKALRWNELERESLWNVLALITDMGMGGYIDGNNKLDRDYSCGYRLAITNVNNNTACVYKFNDNSGGLGKSQNNFRMQIRPVFK